jgi:hypothetical protein
MEPHTLHERPDMPGVLLGVSLIFLLIALLVAALVFAPAKFQHGWGTVFGGIYLVAWGFMFLAAYYQSHTNFFLRALLWVCERFPGRGGKKMALLWSVCAFLVGGSIILSSLGVI